jgi:ABC-2 type transport system ATP-binding protein
MWKTQAALFYFRVTPRYPYVWSLMAMQLCGVTT